MVESTLRSKAIKVTMEMRARFSRKYCARLIAFFILSVFLGVYLVFSPTVNYDFYNNKVLFKQVKCTALDSSVLEGGREVSFKNCNGIMLSGIFYPMGAGKKTILIHHGMGYNMNFHAQHSAKLARKLNANVFVYDYAGFGKSAGKPTVRGLADDARAALDFVVHSLNVEPANIVHYGGSLGTGPATLIASEQPCAGLILFAPYASIKECARDILPFMRLYPDWLIVDRDLETRQNIARVKCPVLIIHGDKDSVIGVNHGAKVFAAANQPKQFLRVKEGGHFCGGESTEPYIAQFVKSL